VIALVHRIPRSPSGFLGALDRRGWVVVGIVLLAILAEVASPLPGLRLLVVLGVIAAPALLFVALWRVIGLLGESRAEAVIAARHRPGSRVRRILWGTFWVLWAADLVATVAFFVVPSLREVVPITVALYGLFGIPGVVLAAASYAAVVVAISRFLPAPRDADFVAAVVLLYAVFVVHNFVLLFETGIHEYVLWVTA
jgi:hypothetical protein